METKKILGILVLRSELLRRVALVLALGLMMCQAEVSEAGPMGTAFTYQGHLYDANDVANGLYDFAFKLYDANVGGSKAANDVNVGEVDVIDGYFTVELDFSSSVFDGNAVWLEIGVRPGDLNDPNAYTTLSPRQEVTPTPYALYAESAGGDNDWRISGNNMYSIPDGNVGIGTSSPDEKLTLPYSSHIGWEYSSGNSTVAHKIGKSSNGAGPMQFITTHSPGATGQLFTFYKSGDEELVSMLWNGNVGIGTTSPTSRAEVFYTDSSTTTASNGLTITNNAGTIGNMVGVRLSTGGSGSQSKQFIGAIRGGMWGVGDIVFLNRNVSDASTVTMSDERMRITSTGDVGIGTSSPDEKLTLPYNSHIGWEYSSGNSTVTHKIGKSSNGAGPMQFITTHSPGATGQLFTFYKSGDEELVSMLWNGNVGIGTTSPQAQLQVGDTSTGHSIYVAGPTTGQSAVWFYDGSLAGGMQYTFTTDDLLLYTAGTARLMIDSTGDVGIGTLAPTEKLDVDGTARLRGISAQAGATYVHVDGNGKLWKITSSKKYKTNIRDLNSDPMAVLELRPVKYQCRISGKEDVGLIAEEVEQVLKDLVIHNDDGSPEAVKYDRVSLYLLAVVKELKAENEALRQRLEALEKTRLQHQFSVAKEVQQ